MAMGRLAEQLSGTLDFTWNWKGKQQPAVKSAKAVFEKEIATSPKSGTVSVKNKGKGALSVDLITRTQLLNDTLPAIADNIRLDVKYTDMAGSPISVEDIRQGNGLYVCSHPIQYQRYFRLQQSGTDPYYTVRMGNI